MNFGSNAEQIGNYTSLQSQIDLACKNRAGYVIIQVLRLRVMI